MNKKEFCANCGSREFIKEGKSEALHEVSYLVCADCGNVMMRDDRTGMFMPTPEDDSIMTRLLMADSAKALGIPNGFVAFDEEELKVKYNEFLEKREQEWSHENDEEGNEIDDCCYDCDEDCNHCPYIDEEDEEDNEKDECPCGHNSDAECDHECVNTHDISNATLEKVLKDIFGGDIAATTIAIPVSARMNELPDIDADLEEKAKEFFEKVILPHLERPTTKREEIAKEIANKKLGVKEKREDYVLVTDGKTAVIKNTTEKEMAEYVFELISKGELANGYRLFKAQEVGKM